jgi:ADP-ribose pyrophosphatase YjhB (NUDIX family)
VCDACGTIHYSNPRIVAGCVPEWQGRILICRRAIEPRRGFWTIPAGFMENGETLMAAAAREAQEEALADVEMGSLLAIVQVMHANQVHVFFRARLRVPTFGAGPESLEVALVTESEVPWSEIAFASGDYTLRRYFEDRAAGREALHVTEIERGRRGPAPDQRTE